MSRALSHEHELRHYSIPRGTIRSVPTRRLNAIAPQRQQLRSASQTRRQAVMTDLDAVVIGAGHNGLTCAAYLAMAGLKVHVQERQGVVGGACITQEFHPGFRNSTAAYTVSLLQPKVIRDLKLHEHDHQDGTRPHRIGTSRRFPSWPMIVSIVVVGQWFGS